LKANSIALIGIPIMLVACCAGSVIGIDSREKLVVGSYPRTAMATADTGANPMATRKGGNSAGVTTPNEVKNEPKPMPTYKAWTSLPITCCLMTREMVPSAPVSRMRKIISIVAATEMDMPKLLRNPNAEAPNATSIGVLNWKTAKIMVSIRPANAMVKPLCRRKATPKRITRSG